jgi:hypothetical protein
MLLMFVKLGGFLALVFLLVMLVLRIVTGGGLLTMFFISSEGVSRRAGSTTSNLNRAATNRRIAPDGLVGRNRCRPAGNVAGMECARMEQYMVHLGLPVRALDRVPVPGAHKPGR